MSESDARTAQQFRPSPGLVAAYLALQGEPSGERPWSLTPFRGRAARRRHRLRQIATDHLADWLPGLMVSLANDAEVMGARRRELAGPDGQLTAEVRQYAAWALGGLPLSPRFLDALATDIREAAQSGAIQGDWGTLALQDGIPTLDVSQQPNPFDAYPARRPLVVLSGSSGAI